MTLAGHFSDGRNLNRINLENGEFENLFIKAFSYSLSPDGNFIIYSLIDEPGWIHIKDFTKNQDRKIDLNQDFVISGIYSWKQDSSEVAFASGALYDRNDIFGDITSTSIFKITIKNFSLITLLQKSEQLLVPGFPYSITREKIRDCSDCWVDDNTLHIYPLEERFGRYEYLNDVTLDIHTGEIRRTTLRLL